MIVVLAGAVLLRYETKSLPPLRIQSVLPASVTFPGPAPRPSWPGQGEAAAAVMGIGSLGSSGSGTPEPIASVAKIMTAYVVLRDHPVAAGQSGFTVTISQADVNDYQERLAAGEVVTAVVSGETLSEVDLLEALLVASGNNVARILAEHDAGSQSAFVAKMNAAAQSLGMTRTTYTDPSGVDTTTVSTAADQLLLAQAAMNDPVFARIVAMPAVTLPFAGTVANFNHAVGSNGFIGIKTGSDASAGGCLVFANRRNVGGRSITVVGVVLGQLRGTTATSALAAAALDAATALVDSIYGAVSVRTVLPAGTTAAVVSNAQGRRVSATTDKALSLLGWGGLTVPLSLSTSPIGRQVHTGQTVATVVVRSTQPVTTIATAVSSMPALTAGWRLLHLF